MENEFKVTRSSRRKRIALRIAPDGVLEVLAPHNEHGKSLVIQEIIAPDGSLVEDAKLVQSIYKIACPYPLKKGDFLRRRVR